MMRICTQAAWVCLAVLVLSVGSSWAQQTQAADAPKPAPPNAAPTPTGGGDTAAPKPQEPQQDHRNQSQSPLQSMWFPLILIGGFVVLYIFMGRGRRRQDTKRKQMLAALKKGDKVVTIGGVLGTIMDAKEDEVTIKVDETNNVRMRFARWAVRGVGEEARAETPQDQKK